VSFFGKILDKLGLSHTKATSGSGQEPPAGAQQGEAAAPLTETGTAAEHSVSPANVPPMPVSVVDVMAHLEELAAANPQKLNWRRSIVDLLKLLDIDSSYAARKELATELGCPAELMGDSAQMNMWLHKTVLQKIADNGGNIPTELLD